MLWSKDIGWLVGFKKKKTLQYTAYKRFNSGWKTHTDWEWGDWKKICHANGNDKKGVAIFISDKTDFKTKPITKDKEGHYIIIKGSIREKDITLINIYIPNTRAPKYIKQILTDIKEKTDNNTIIVGDFNTPLTSMDRSSRQQINKATGVLNDTTDQWT